MKTLQSTSRQRAFTVLELLVLLVTLAILAAFLLPPVHRNKAAIRIPCVNNLKQVGLAFRIWSGDNNDLYSMRFFTNSDGTAKFTDSANLFRYFQVMSNELNSPKVLICPGDAGRKAATNFTGNFGSSNISYFAGLDADETQPAMFLSGDRNLTNGFPLNNGLMNVTTNQSAGWTMEIHKGNGNVALADGSVQQLGTMRLRQALADTGTNVNRLLFP